jgi:hypothetical protein
MSCTITHEEKILFKFRFKSVADHGNVGSPSIAKKGHRNSHGKGVWFFLNWVQTNKKTCSLRYTSKQHAGSNTTEGATHVFRVGFIFPSTLALMGVNEYEDVVYPDCKHQERNHLQMKQVPGWRHYNAHTDETETFLQTFLLSKQNSNGVDFSFRSYSSSGNHEIPHNSSNSKIHYRVHNSPPVAHILSHMNPIRALRYNLISILIL